jgi:hypothetical protein
MARFTQDKPISLAEVIKAGITMPETTLYDWGQRWGWDRVIDWKKNPTFREFAESTKLVSKLVNRGFLSKDEVKLHQAGEVYRVVTRNTGSMFFVQIISVGPLGVGLLVLNNGTTWGSFLPFHKIKSLKAITEDQFAELMKDFSEILPSSLAEAGAALN